MKKVMRHRNTAAVVKALRISIGLFTLCMIGLFAQQAWAAPEARILRIDPRASTKSGNPVITSVVELQQSKRISQATAHCATLSKAAHLSCIAEALDKPLYQTLPFPEQNAIFTVTVDGSDRPAKLISVEEWGKSQKQSGVGTAWLILIDADSRMANSYDEAVTVAQSFVSSMGPSDIVNVMFFNDRQVFSDSNWLPASKKSQAVTFVQSVPGTIRSSGRNRPLLTIIRNAATDGFRALGNVGQSITVPMHQAMVVLSTGFGGADPSSTGPGAATLSDYMTGGRFPEDNTALPKTPVPVISIYFPAKTFDEFSNNSLEFMQNLANPHIGGFFNIMQDGEGARANGIVRSVRTRFSKMYLAKWRVSCIAPSVTQTFRLLFKDTNPPIAPDATFKDVPLGVDPTTWPLDVNVEQTKADAKEGIHPGGKFRVYGDFCWGGDKSRAEVYFLPAGQAPPSDLTGSDVDQAKQAQQHLISQGMRGEVLQTADTFAEFQAPDNDKLIHGSGSQAVARLVVYDNRAARSSGVTADTIVQVPARPAPFPIVMVLGGLLGLVLVALVLVLVTRGGGKKKRGGGGGRPPPAPIVAGPAPMMAHAPAPMMGGGAFEPPPAVVNYATLQGAAGIFTLMPNVEMRAGRDGATCAVLLADPSVSSVHATLKLEAGQLWIRDENSNNGTFVGGARLVAGQWTPVPHGGSLRFGPLEFTARLQ